MIKYFNHIIVIILSLVVHTITAQNIQIKSSLDTNLIKIGEQTKLTIDIQYPKTINAVWPLMRDTVNEKVEIVDFSLDTILTPKGFHHFLINYTLTSFDSGYYVIPPQIIINPETKDTLESQALMLAVASFVIDSTKQNSIFDIKAPIAAPWTLSEFLAEYYPYLIGGLLLIALIFAIFWCLKKQKNKEQVPVKKIIPKEAAHIIALRELNQLKEQKLWQNDRVKLYYIELSDIIRNYLENRFRIKSLEQTSQEIFDTVQNNAILDKEQLLQLKQILSTADMAKFAKAKPLANENDLALKNAFELIEKTKLDDISTKTEETTKIKEEDIKEAENA